MGGGSGGGDDGEVRYAPYLERAHGDLLNHDGNDQPALSLIDCFNAGLNSSPYVNYEALPVDGAMFGSGYTIEDFPSLWDMFGKFMGALDVCDLYGQIYENIVHAPEINNAVTAHSEILQNDIDTKVMPNFLAGMRDINSVMASSFVIGKSIIQSAHVREVNKFASEIRLKAVDASIKVWERHLDWNKAVIAQYSGMQQSFFSIQGDVDRNLFEYQTKDALWNLNLFDYTRSMLGALGGGSPSQGSNEPSQTQKSIGGAMSGAATGAAVTGMNPVGAVIGGAIGLAASFF